MARSLPEFARLAALLCLGSTGCTFEDGEPWGEARVLLSVGFEVPEDRVLDDGIRTSTDYAVRLSRVAVELTAIRISQSGDTGGPAGFDPADPPPGYSLCHNGHCHSADGRLVDYAEIEVEVLGEAATGAVTEALIERAVDVPLDGRTELSTVRLDLPAGGLVSFGLVVAALRVEGRVEDLRRPARLDTARRDFAYSLPLDVQLVTALRGAVGRDGPSVQTLRPHFAVPITVLDTIDFAGPGLSAEAVEPLLTGTVQLETNP